MKVPPRLLLAMLATLGVAGCRAAGTQSIAHNRPPQVQTRPRFDLDAFVAEHNANAARIKSIEARPTIIVKYNPPNERSVEGRADGKLALERPRNFKLELSRLGSTVADIGSNDDRFWFWFSNKQDKSVYVCNYEDLGATTLAATYQPDWIAEALGLKEISGAEAAQVKVRPGPVEGTTVLSFPAARGGSQAYSRLLIVSDRTRKVSEIRIFTPDGKTQLAQATIPKYREITLSAEDASSKSTAETCELPDTLTLEWLREHLKLDVVLRDAKVNQFDPGRRTALFTEPAPEGYAQVNMAEAARRNETPEGKTAVRETLPAPEPRSPRVRLTPPLQLRGDKAAALSPKVKPNEWEAQGLSSAVLLPVLDLDIVSAPTPRAPGEPIGAAQPGLAAVPPPSLGR